ncbi:hypothetical protein Pcinc_022638 [Petrolisthes cinctipes]|uniref:Uncharacterized protein n=1 Tax=Petrolisthes cinctipes TaxID=88211 RepID=A0AAE1FFX2_PETCI|nr:hypothetical protein Pcinc_022638 [Petrolisthes cinctipes]
MYILPIGLLLSLHLPSTALLPPHFTYLLLACFPLASSTFYYLASPTSSTFYCLVSPSLHLPSTALFPPHFTYLLLPCFPRITDLIVSTAGPLKTQPMERGEMSSQAKGRKIGRVQMAVDQ